MNSILYYSNFCEKSKNLLKILSKSTIKDEIHFICIDKRSKNNEGEMRENKERKKLLLKELAYRILLV